MAAFLSFLLHLYATSSAILANLPAKHHGSSIQRLLHPHTKDRSKIQRTGTAVTRILWAVSDHPAISAVGWDVLMSLFSMCAWTVVGSVNPDGILRCTLVPGLDEDGMPPASGEDVPVERYGYKFMKQLTEQEDATRAPAKNGRSSGRAKAKATDKDRSSSAPRRRSSRKETDNESQSRERSGSAPRRRSSRRRVTEDADDAFVPSTALQKQLERPVPVAKDDDTVTGHAEPVALVLGLWMVGGLGVASAGVFGAEAT